MTASGADPLAHLRNPDGIAIVGASDIRYYATSIITNLRNAGYPEHRIYPVNPRYTEVAGLPCYPSVKAIGKPASLVVAATGRDTIPGIVEQAGDAGAKTVIVLADGYAEQDDEGRRLQEELGELARRAGVRVIGPNTLGYVAPAGGASVWAPGTLARPVKPGGIGIVFQSSGMLNLFVHLCVTRRVGVRAAFSVGNELGVSTADMIRHLADDPETTVIAALLENTDRPRELATALECARAAGKPVIMVKLGRSERARKNAIAHTGRLASSSTAWDALLERLKVVVVGDLDELIECATLFDAAIQLRTGPYRPALVTVSGGDCSLLSDLADQLALPLAELEAPTHARLVELMDKPKLLGNPLDVENLFRVDEGRFYEVIDTLCADAGTDLIAYRMYLPTAPSAANVAMYTELVKRTLQGGKVPVVISRAVEDFDHEWYRLFDELSTPFLPSYRPALTALARLSQWDSRPTEISAIDVSTIPLSPRPQGATALAGWHDTQQLLADAGIPYSPARLVSDAEEAVRAAADLGYPVAVKLYARDAAHKSELGGVRLGITDADGVRGAAEAIADSARNAGVGVDGYEVQAMSERGVEMIVGVSRDATLGPLVMVGMGGVLAEITSDVVVFLPETSAKDVARHLKRLRGHSLLTGYRGSPPADVDALADMVAALSRYVIAHPDDVAELDLNPVMVLGPGRGIVAVDAVLVTEQ